MAEFRPRTTDQGIVGEKFEGIIGCFKKPPGHGLIILPNVPVDSLQIAEHILAFIVTHYIKQKR